MIVILIIIASLIAIYLIVEKIKIYIEKVSFSFETKTLAEKIYNINMLIHDSYFCNKTDVLELEKKFKSKDEFFIEAQEQLYKLTPIFCSELIKIHNNQLDNQKISNINLLYTNIQILKILTSMLAISNIKIDEYPFTLNSTISKLINKK